MPDLASFNTENYRKTRAYLQTMPRFDWRTGYQSRASDAGCVACAAVRACEKATGLIATTMSDIERVLQCSREEASNLYLNTARGGFQAVERDDVQAAIARLDVVAARYGVTPEPEPAAAPVENHEAAFLESCRQVIRDVTHA